MSGPFRSTIHFRNTLHFALCVQYLMRWTQPHEKLFKAISVILMCASPDRSIQETKCPSVFSFNQAAFTLNSQLLNAVTENTPPRLSRLFVLGLPWTWRCAEVQSALQNKVSIIKLLLIWWPLIVLICLCSLIMLMLIKDWQDCWWELLFLCADRKILLGYKL